MAQIANYSNYEIFEDGRIYNLKTNRWVSFSPRNDGYSRVSLMDDTGIRKSCYVHRLVAMAYLPNPNNLPCINHKDENRSNNHVNNLEWCTYEYNNNYGNHITKMLEHRIYEAPSTAIQVAQLDKKTEEIIQIFPSIKEASRAVNGSAGHINEVVHGKRKTAYGYKWKIIGKI